MRRLAWIGAFAALAMGCGPVDGSGEDEGLIDVATLEDFGDKEDTAGGRYVRVNGSIAFGSTKILRQPPGSQGYTFTLRSAADIEVRSTGPTLSLVHLYGPRRPDGSWGRLVMKRWGNDEGDRVLRTRLSALGKYLIVVRPQSDGDYFLTLCREGGRCTQYCVEKEDPPSPPPPGHMANYTLTNVSSPEEWEWRKRLGGLEGSFLIRAGSCGSQSRACPATRSPVCGSDFTTTYANACEAKVAARARLGSSWGPGGMGWTYGACGQEEG